MHSRPPAHTPTLPICAMPAYLWCMLSVPVALTASASGSVSVSVSVHVYVCARDTAQLICIFYWLPFNYLHFTEFLATAGTSRASLNSPPSSPSCWPQPSWPPVNCPGKCSRLPFDRRSLYCIYFQLILIKRCTGQRGGRGGGQVCVRTAYTYKHILERLIANCKMHKIVIYFLVLSFAYAQWAKTMQKCIKKKYISSNVIPLLISLNNNIFNPFLSLSF